MYYYFNYGDCIFSKLMYLLQIRSLDVDSNYTIGNLPFDMVSGEFEENFSKIQKKNAKFSIEFFVHSNI